MRPRCWLPRRRRRLEHNQCHGPFNFFPPARSLPRNVSPISSRLECYSLDGHEAAIRERGDLNMRRLLAIAAVAICFSPALCQENKSAASGHYLFAWTGDVAHQGNDFLAVIDADPSSSSYGHLVTTLATDQQTRRVHHTEYSIPASGMLFANDH